MRNLNLLAAAAFSFVLLTGCEKETEGPLTPASPAGAAKHTTEKAGDLSQYDAPGNPLVANPALPSATHPQFRNLILGALNAADAEACDANTPISLWLDETLVDWDSTLVSYVLATDMLNLPTYDALVFENSSAGQSYGVNGEYTKLLTKTFRDLKRFWNIPADDMVMVAMHGSIMGDRDKLIRTYMAAYGLGAADAAYFADYVLAILAAYPQLEGGDHPIFTFNAFALQGFDFGPYGIIPNKIVMGDGILEGFAAIGFGDIAPQAILAHEFAHQIQFHLDLFAGSGPEATRRTELMADAYAAYYLSHARGATMQWKRVQQFLQVFFNIGDCSFESNGHHGTPAQRMAAAEWGYQLADSAQKQGHILSPEEFAVLFEAQLDQLVML